MTPIGLTKRTIFAALIALVALAGVRAQPTPAAVPAGAPAAPATLNSPEVSADGRITFRLRAPQAKEVSMQPEPGAIAPMVKDDDGVWSVTVGPWAPDVYAYRFIVDGTRMPDPSNGAPLKTSRPNVAGEVGQLGGWQSQVVVPNPAKPEPWEKTAIPHGIVSYVEFWSPTMGAYRDYYVYTPPGYDGKRAEPYPVLYLLHGAGENASGWINNGRANLILDSLIAEGKAVPMIVVMPLGHPAQAARTGAAVPGVQSAAAAAAITPAPGAGGNSGPYFASLINEIIPQVEASFNAGKTKAQRAIAGLSMGGGQTFNLALANPDKFTYVGMFSSAVALGGGGGRGGAPAAAPATPPPPFVLPAEATAEWGRQFKLLWIACGREDFLFANNTTFKAALKERGVPFEDVVTPGAHNFSVWKRYLADFVPLIFRP
ncbi:MAG TPA: alpha/beta hydrolase-fold protein [Opitutaceae bacterium]